LASDREEGRQEADNLGKIFALFVCGFLAFVVILAILERLGAPAPDLNWAVVLVPLAIYVLIGFLTRTNEPADFAVAGRSVPALYNGMATSASFLSASSFLGLAGTLFLLGYDGLAYVLGGAGGFVLAAILIAPYLRKSGAETIPDFFGLRYGGPARLLAVAILVCSTFALLVAELSATGLVASRFLAIPFDWALCIGLGALVLATILGGMAAVTWVQVAQLMVLLVAYLAPIFILSAQKYGFSLPQLSYGAAVQQITGLETGMLEKGLADARVLKPYAKAFLQYDQLNFFALILCLMTGTASLPHVLTRFLTARSAGDARFSAVWALLFIFLLFITAPAYAAFAKLEVYSLIEKGTRLAQLPAWMETASRLDLVRIHGVSLAMLDDAVAAVRAGASDLQGVTAYMKAQALDRFASWSELKEPVRVAVLDVAKSALAFNEAQKWDAFSQTVLPAAALAAGNKTALLTQGALAFDPNAILMSIPEIAGMSYVVGGFVAAGALAAALATAEGVLITITNALSHDVHEKLLGWQAPPARRLLISRALLVIVAVLAAYAAMVGPGDLAQLVTFSFSLAAAGLFPALVLGVWWTRANGWGAVAGMAAGFGVCVYYLAGTHYFPVGFYETWGHLSNASEAAARKFASLKAAWSVADGDAKGAAWAALEAQARGTPMRTGIANWFGVEGAGAAVFALPVGFVLIFVLSLITGRPDSERRAFVEQIRSAREERPASSGEAI
jgi:cation/acetate symporter